MLVRLKHARLDAALPLLQLGVVALALRADTGWGSIAALSLLLASGLYGWLRSVQHARLILDTPTSRIASAAQGDVELRGRARALDAARTCNPSLPAA